jgi:hypothetical protein
MTSIYVTVRHNMSQYVTIRHSTSQYVTICHSTDLSVSHAHKIQWAVSIKLSFGYSNLCENGAWLKQKPSISGNFLARKYTAKMKCEIA